MWLLGFEVMNYGWMSLYKAVMPTGLSGFMPVTCFSLFLNNLSNCVTFPLHSL